MLSLEAVCLSMIEKKRYILRHFVSGKILTCDNGILKLQERNEVGKGVETVSVVIKNKAKDVGKERYVDRNSIMQIKFNGTQGEKKGTLSIGKSVKFPNVQLDINTTWYYGFKLPEDYLKKQLNTERFQPKVSETADDQSSSFKFAKLSNEETKSILLVESLTNQFTKFMDFLHNFLKGSEYTLMDFNAEIIKLTAVCKKFLITDV